MLDYKSKVDSRIAVDFWSLILNVYSKVDSRIAVDFWKEGAYLKSFQSVRCPHLGHLGFRFPVSYRLLSSLPCQPVLNAR
jgi:hypothetical protein